MNIRKGILILLGLVILGGSFMLAKRMIGLNIKQQPIRKENVTKILVDTVINSTHVVNISTSGTLMAKRRLDIYSEVQGVFLMSRRDFKPGTYFKKGELLVALDREEYNASILAQRSSLFNQLAQMLPDLQLDYPLAYPGWKKYIDAFDIEGNLKALPEPISEQERLFISGKNIFTSFYTIRNMELRSEKYRLYAPFSGILIESLADPGTLVRSGQKIGQLIDPSNFELEVSVNENYLEHLQPGAIVTVWDLDRIRSWNGSVTRINGIVNTSSQTVLVYIKLKNRDLREGMYLQADVTARKFEKCFVIDRKLLVGDDQIYIVKEGVLLHQYIEPVFFKDKQVIIKGLDDETIILAKDVPGAFPGMKVEVLK